MFFNKFQSKSSEEIRKERRAEIDAQSVFTKLKAKKISQKTKKALARQSLQNIVSHSQKNFTNFKNSFGGQNLGIVLKKVTTEGDSERIEESEKPEKESEKLEAENKRTEKDLGASTNISISEANGDSREASSSGSEPTKSTVSEVGKAQCLVSYEMSASDSDDSGQ